MFSKKLSIAFSLILSTVISGCASTKTYDSTTSSKREVYEPTKNFSGIETVKLDNSKLSITLIDKTLFEEYDVFLENGNTRIDLAKKTKTGKSEWGYVKRPHKIIVLGFDKDYEFIVEPNNNEVKIDLEPIILNSQLPKNTNLTIRCEDCDLLSIKEQNLFPNIKTDFVLRHDFRLTKLALIETQKNRAVEAEKAMRDKEIATKAQIQKIDVALTPAVAATDESVISNLEEIKTQCAKLFKPKTDKFGKCVLELSK
jgi:hypothetical protein